MGHRTVRPLLASPILDSAILTPMQDTPSSRPKKIGTRNTEVGEDEGSKSRKRPFEGRTQHQRQDRQPREDLARSKRQKVPAHAQGELSHHVNGLQDFGHTMQPNPIASWGTSQTLQPPHHISSNCLSQPSPMSYEQVQGTRIQHVLSMKRSLVPENHQHFQPPPKVPRQVVQLDTAATTSRLRSESRLRPEHQIAYQHPPLSYGPPASQSTTNTHTRLPPPASVMYIPRKQQSDSIAVERSQNQRIPTRVNQSLSPELPKGIERIVTPRIRQTNLSPADRSLSEQNTARCKQSITPYISQVSHRASQMRRDQDTPQDSPVKSPESIHRKSHPRPRLANQLQSHHINRTSPKPCFVPPKLPSMSFFDIMYNYEADELKPYLNFLSSLQILEYKVEEKRLAITQISHDHDPKQYNDWLLSLLPVGRKEIQNFRSLSPPEDYDYSLLARCIRFALSPAEKKFSWTIHPQHVALIMERTDKYGKARTNEREERVEAALERRRFVAGMGKVFALVRPEESFEEFVRNSNRRAVKE